MGCSRGYRIWGINNININIYISYISQERLSFKQLNAYLKAEFIKGDFFYDPVLDDMLTAGTHTLKTTFIPEDKDNYLTATKYVEINITRAKPTILWNPPKFMICNIIINII